ncbi:fused PTS fructose transporter subunit IIA/HPr protein [Psittacicella hinzii]|uniref:Uncharacterized protein n=1 Tax=Psittacicella hinzii TaxID=2028575 RepID=A0A3A1YML8_9GAMM|nr:fused PTS fructose transporter subunit IIA/HPr protein [Psittacicella hinzii]RIY38801.1 hypothetical protein CKF58_03220 [Psittacicella hinzii]
MLNLSENDVLLNQKAATKEDAIRIVSKVLADNGRVDPGYVDGMLERENQTSTYLDNGVAIPHGTTKTRDLVKQTGVAVVQFPEGVVWNEDGDKTFIAFGIAASSNDHLPILKAITNIIGEEEEAAALTKATTKAQLLRLIQGEPAAAPASANLALIKPELVDLAAKATNLPGLQALNAANLLAQEYISSDFFAKSLETAPVHLGSGLWLNAATCGNKHNGIALVRPAQTLSVNNVPVKALATVVLTAQGDAALLAKLVNHADTLTTGDLATVLGVFGLGLPAQASQPVSVATAATAANNAPAPKHEQVASLSKAAQEVDSSAVVGTFIIHNENGLHARPSTELVRVCKQFNADITVENLSTGSAPVKAKSMVRVTGLGAVKGSELKFTATGADAEQAIAAIGKAIADGLGE